MLTQLGGLLNSMTLGSPFDSKLLISVAIQVKSQLYIYYIGRSTELE
jgi:hypothetical protein